jgi:hypothetical protein
MKLYTSNTLTEVVLSSGKSENEFDNIMDIFAIVVSLLQLVTHTGAIVWIKFIKYKMCNIDKNMLSMLYCFEIAYGIFSVYSLLNYFFKDEFGKVQMVISFLFPFINGFIMVTLILFIFELRRLSLFFQHETLEDFLKSERKNLIMGRWCIGSTLFQALLIGYTNINRIDDYYIIESKLVISLIVLLATV